MERRNLKMLKKINNHRLVIFFLVITVLNLTNLMHYPVASVDESWQSSNSYSIFNHEFVSINYPFFLQNTGIPYVMNFLLGLVYKVFGFGLFQGRIFIFGLSVILLSTLYGFSKYFFGKTVAFLSVIYFASTRVFLYSSHFIRNDVPLTILMIISLWLFLYFLKNGGKKYLFFSGLILGIASEVHQNAIFFIISTIFAWIIVKRSAMVLLSKDFFAYLMGIISYCIYYLFAHVMPNIPLYLSERKYSILNDHALPILSMPLSEMFFSEINRYYSYFYPLRVLEAGIIFISIIWSMRQKSLTTKFIIYFVANIFILFFFFASNKSEYYLIYFFVLVSIIISNFFTKLINSIFSVSLIPQKVFSKNSLSKSDLLFSIRFKFFYIFLIIFNFLTVFGVVFNYRTYDYKQIQIIVSPFINKDSLILGPTNYFLPLNHLNYRSFYVLPWYRIFKGYNTKQAIEEIKPDFVVVDSQVEQMLEEDENNISNKLFYKNLYKISKREFNDFLNNETSLLIKNNSDYLNNFKLYKVNYD